jgi:hypothetical protein
MANLIVRHHPVVPLVHKENPVPRINEMFAVFHALCICSDFSDGDEFSKFCKTTEFKVFFEDITYLLSRNFTPENLIMVFKTLCLYQFKSFSNNKIDG